MNSNKKFKVNIVNEITQKLKIAKSFLIVDYQKITVKQFEKLRSKLREKDVDIKVYKNRLFKIAAKKIGLEKLESSLIGSNVFVFNTKDDVSFVKVLAKFSKKFKVLKFKSGFFEGKIVDVDEINKIALLPTFEEAIAKLAIQFISPIKYIGVGLNQLSTKIKNFKRNES